jgi:hypothetical protein
MEIGQRNCYGCKIIQEHGKRASRFAKPAILRAAADQAYHSAHYARTKKKAR